MPHSRVELSKNDREAIRLYRLSARRTQQEIADTLGKSQRWYGRIEGDGRLAIFTVGHLYRLAKVLGVSRSDLTGL